MNNSSIIIDADTHVVVSRELILQAIASLWDYSAGAPFGKFDRDCIAQLEDVAVWPIRKDIDRSQGSGKLTE